MREITVSTGVFAKIWSLRQSGEETEDQILARVLASPPAHDPQLTRASEDGFADRRHGVRFPEGFRIFRHYKGALHFAVAKNGCWELSNGKRYSSLNELSRAVTHSPENAWVSWSFEDDEGRAHKLAELRNEKRKPKTETRISNTAPSATNLNVNQNLEEAMTWRNDVVNALRQLGGKSQLENIYRVVEQIRNARGATLPPSLEAIVRRELENNSSDSESFLGRHDLFYSVSGIGGGEWGLR